MSTSPLRSGYTTGACATAATKAATLALLRGHAPDQVSIPLPAGITATFTVVSCEPEGDGVCCAVIKDAGDDPDVTHGAEIRATVRRTAGQGVELAGGPGVGVVTKPGLELPVGSAAINPVPRQMIEAAVRDAASQAGVSGGFHVTISVPGGEALAERTLNGRLGIVGGISILGTAGIVKPFSHDAYKACVLQALDVARAGGCTEVVLTTGRRTERCAMQWLRLPEEAFIQMGDFVGHALHGCCERGFAGVTVVAMIGKMVKIAAGHEHTHADVSELETEVLVEVARETGGPPELLAALSGAHTAREAGEILREQSRRDVFDALCSRARGRCRAHLDAATRVAVLLCGFDGELLGRADADA